MPLLASVSAHLERCANRSCRRMLLTSDVTCPHCGVERTSFKFFRASWVLSKYVLAPLAVAVAVYLVFSSLEHRREKMAEEVRRSQR